METMEKLLAEADAKFNEKLQMCKQGVPTNMGVYSDRTYNLRQQIAHNSQLTGDAHFLQLLEDTERLLAPEYAIRGEIDRKLYSLLAGLLKTLLREAVGVQSFAPRKIQIEMIWQWYEDKKSTILQFELQRTGGSAKKEGLEVHGSKVSFTATGADDTQRTVASPVQSDTSAAFPARPHAPEVQRSKFANKFDNLRRDTSAEEEREASTPRTEASSRTGASVAFSSANQQDRAQPLTFTQEAVEGRGRAVIAKKLGLYKKRNLVKSERLRQEAQARAQTAGPASQVRVVYTKDSKQRGHGHDAVRAPACHGPSGPGVCVHHPSMAPQLTKEQSEARNLDAAVANAQRRWVSHMAREVEVEHDNREMRDVLSMFAFNQARTEEESSRKMESALYSSQSGRTCHKIVRREQQRAADGEPVACNSLRPSASVDNASDLLGKVLFQGSEISLSPYDHFQPTPLDEERLRGLLDKLSTPDELSEDVKRRLGLTTAHPRCMSATSARNCGTLDVSNAAEVKVTGAVPRSDKPLMEILFPALAAEDDVPSVNRMEQLRLVERIRECFARVKTKDGGGLHLPRAVIESAVLTPDDRPYEECVRLLPRASSFLPRNPNAAKEKAGASKKKKKK